MSKKNFSQTFASNATLDSIFAKPNKTKPDVILKTENQLKEDVEQDITLDITADKEQFSEVIDLGAQKKNETNEKKAIGRPPITDREKRDKKFTFNTTKTLASLIEEARLLHNQSLKSFGVEVDESKFIEYLISTHPKVNAN